MKMKHELDEETLLPKGQAKLYYSHKKDSVIAKGLININLKFEGLTSLSLENGHHFEIRLLNNLPSFNKEVPNSMMVQSSFEWEKTFVDKNFKLSLKYFILNRKESNPLFQMGIRHSSTKFSYKVERYLYNASNSEINYTKVENTPFLCKIDNNLLAEGIVKNIVIKPGETYLIETIYTNSDDLNELSDIEVEGLFDMEGKWIQLSERKTVFK